MSADRINRSIRKVYELYDLTEEEIAIVEESSPDEISEVNINTASAPELEPCSTGLVLIAGRPYRSVEDAALGALVGKKTLARFRDKIVLN